MLTSLRANNHNFTTNHYNFCNDHSGISKIIKIKIKDQQSQDQQDNQDKFNLDFDNNVEMSSNSSNAHTLAGDVEMESDSSNASTLAANTEFKLPSNSELPMSLSSVLDEFSFSDKMQDYLLENLNSLSNWGLRDTSYYREKFLRITDEMSDEARTLLLMLCCTVGDKDKILTDIDLLPDTLGRMDDVKKILRRFFVQLSSEAESKPGKFAVSDVQTSFPGLDLHFWAMTTPPDKITFENLHNRLSFSQIWLDSEMQSEAEDGYYCHWENMFDGGVDFPESVEELYSTRASEKYLLFSTNGTEDNRTTAYNKTDIENWIATRKAYASAQREE